MERNLRKERTGLVVSNKMDKTIIVEVARKHKHEMYEKYINKRSRFVAHDDDNTANIGDKVTIMETRPLSKRKNWRLVKINERAK